MNRNEADELKKLIDSFVTVDEIMTGETITITGLSEEPKPVKRPTEEELKKMFRGNVPEGFSFDTARVIRFPLSGDRVFLEFGGEKRWIPDPETLDRLGFKIEDAVEITDEEAKDLKEGYQLFPAKLW